MTATDGDHFVPTILRLVFIIIFRLIIQAVSASLSVSFIAMFSLNKICHPLNLVSEKGTGHSAEYDSSP